MTAASLEATSLDAETLMLVRIAALVAVLWPPFYNSVEPALWGIPFFYWYQLAWVIIGAVLTAIVYFATRAEH